MCKDRISGLVAGNGMRISRRTALQGAAAATLTVALGPVCGAHAAGANLSSLHGQGFCNLNLFLTDAARMAQNEDVNLELITTPTLADTTTMIAAGHVDVGVIAYTIFMALRDRDVPIKMIGGGGVGGLGLLARQPFENPEDLKGKSLATFQMDTLEVMCYDWCKANNIPYHEMDVRYFDTVNSSVQAFYSGDIDLVATLEPWVTDALRDVDGATLVSDGENIYGTNYYTDCVLVATEKAIADKPGELVALLSAMMEAQHEAESDRQGTLAKLVGPYYKTDMDNALIAIEKQPSIVDARNQQDFIIERSRSMMEMGYSRNVLDEEAFDWSHLEKAISADQELFDSLKKYEL